MRYLLAGSLPFGVVLILGAHKLARQSLSIDKDTAFETLKKGNLFRNRAARVVVAGFIATFLCVGSGLGQCESPLDQQLIGELTFDTLYSSYQLQPGETIDLNLSTQCCLGLSIGCCLALKPVGECTVWSLDDSSFAKIDPKTGLLTVEQTVPPGQVLTVTASIENGRKVLTIPVFIYNADTHPLVGVWSESARFSCQTGEQFETSEPIRELIFRADGTMFVTRFLFETYHDYTAIYEVKLNKRKVSFTIRQANMLPKRIDGAGRFKLVDGLLVLKELSLGRFTAGETTACRYEFKRVGTQH
ncbi:MAG TPA: hypothetical protein VFF31_14525 [Blastocatellia bacterium]|nr:hypothetical protein [Blastocatellia bacterium]